VNQEITASYDVLLEQASKTAATDLLASQIGISSQHIRDAIRDSSK
jgi:hypothetical protein